MRKIKERTKKAFGNLEYSSHVIRCMENMDSETYSSLDVFCYNSFLLTYGETGSWRCFNVSLRLIDVRSYGIYWGLLKSIPSIWDTDNIGSSTLSGLLIKKMSYDSSHKSLQCMNFWFDPKWLLEIHSSDVSVVQWWNFLEIDWLPTKMF